MDSEFFPSSKIISRRMETKATPNYERIVFVVATYCKQVFLVAIFSC
jgi:hypothetical protein